MRKDLDLKERLTRYYSTISLSPEQRRKEEGLIEKALDALRIGEDSTDLTLPKDLGLEHTVDEGDAGFRIRFLRSKGFSLSSASRMGDSGLARSLEPAVKRLQHAEHITKLRSQFVGLIDKVESYLIPQALAEYFKETPLPDLEGSDWYFKVPSPVTLLRFNKPINFSGYFGKNEMLEGLVIGKARDIDVNPEKHKNTNPDKTFCVYCLYTDMGHGNLAIPESAVFDISGSERFLAGKIGAEGATITDQNEIETETKRMDAKSLEPYAKICRLGVNALIFMNSQNVEVVSSAGQERRFKVGKYSPRKGEVASISDSELDRHLTVQYLAPPHRQRYHIGTRGENLVWIFKWFNRRGPELAPWQDPTEFYKGQGLADFGMSPDNWLNPKPPIS